MRGRWIHVPQSSDEEQRDGFGLYELTLLNIITVREREANRLARPRYPPHHPVSHKVSRSIRGNT